MKFEVRYKREKRWIVCTLRGPLLDESADSGEFVLTAEEFDAFKKLLERGSYYTPQRDVHFIEIQDGGLFHKRTPPRKAPDPDLEKMQAKLHERVSEVFARVEALNLGAITSAEDIRLDRRIGKLAIRVAALERRCRLHRPLESDSTAADGSLDPQNLQGTKAHAPPCEMMNEVNCASAPEDRLR